MLEGPELIGFQPQTSTLISVSAESHCTMFDFVKLGLEDFVDNHIFVRTMLH